MTDSDAEWSEKDDALVRDALWSLRADVDVVELPDVGLPVDEAAALAAGVTVEPTGSRCCRCGKDGAQIPAGDVVSRQFGAYEDWVSTSGLVCPVCAWIYAGDPGLRVDIRLVSRHPRASRVLTSAQACAVLRAGALSPELSLVVPVRPGRKHVLPGAQWGLIATDDLNIAWGLKEARLLGLVVMLRARGVSALQLRSPAPPHQVIQRPGAGAAQVLGAWEELRAWRSPRNPWMAIAIRVTQPSKESQ